MTGRDRWTARAVIGYVVGVYSATPVARLAPAVDGLLEQRPDRLKTAVETH